MQVECNEFGNFKKLSYFPVRPVFVCLEVVFVCLEVVFASGPEK